MNLENYILLSEFQHFAFCRRQWGLIHIENVWQDNFLTVSGQQMHQIVHNHQNSVKRNEKIQSYGLSVISHRFHMMGVCDCVEFTKSASGCRLSGQSELYAIEPVEYKHGKEKEADFLQAAAQAICLEEMFCTPVTSATIYYGKTKERVQREITDDLKRRIEAYAEEMYHYKKSAYVPKVKTRSCCRSCSLKEYCLPKQQTKSAELYYKKHLKRYL